MNLQLVLEQLSRPQERRCPIAKASNEVVELLSEHWAIFAPGCAWLCRYLISLIRSHRQIQHLQPFNHFSWISIRFILWLRVFFFECGVRAVRHPMISRVWLLWCAVSMYLPSYSITRQLMKLLELKLHCEVRMSDHGMKLNMISTRNIVLLGIVR